MTKDEFKEIRSNLDMSNKHLAEMIGVKERILYYYANGERNISPAVALHLRRLAR